MMMPDSPERLEEDRKLLARTLLRLAMPRLIRRVIVIAIVTVLWIFVCRAILSFGASVRYDALVVVGQQAVDLLNRINPYLWWVVVALFTLIVFFSLRGWYANSLAAGRATPVDSGTVRDLARQLSADSIKVLGWVWRDREEPLTVGDLHATLAELRHGRVSKLYLARDQEAALEEGRAADAARTRTEGQAPAREPALTAQRDRTIPIAGERAEPGIGQAGVRAEPRLPERR